MSTDTWTAMIRFAPLTILSRINDEAWQRPGRTMYDTLKLLPGQTTCRLLVDHDDSREIGVVNELVRVDDTDGPWLCALATITDKPEWLRKNETKVSFGYKSVGTRHSFGCEIARGGYVSEVSVLSPSVKPAEPLAKVLTLTRSAAALVTSDRAAAAAGTTAMGHRITELGARGIIVRPGLGKVLGVR